MDASTLPKITLSSPLVGLEIAAAALNKTTKQVSLMVAHRELGPAWDLSLGNRMEVRILAHEVERFQNGEKSQLLNAPSLVGFIFPDAPIVRLGVIAKMRAAVIAHRFSVTPAHVLNLVNAGELELAPGAQCRRGPTGSPEIRFTSVNAFLQRARFI